VQLIGLCIDQVLAKLT